jgi:hypothetical protein
MYRLPSFYSRISQTIDPPQQLYRAPYLYVPVRETFDTDDLLIGNKNGQDIGTKEQDKVPSAPESQTEVKCTISENKEDGFDEDHVIRQVDHVRRTDVRYLTNDVIARKGNQAHMK